MEMGWRVIRNYPCKCVTIVRFVCCSCTQCRSFDLSPNSRAMHARYNMHAFVKWLCFFFCSPLLQVSEMTLPRVAFALHWISCICSLHMNVTHLHVSIKLHIWFPVCVTLFHYSYCFLLSACRCSIAIYTLFVSSPCTTFRVVAGAVFFFLLLYYFGL